MMRVSTIAGDLSGAASMRIAYLECFSGISGDMFLGALIDAGVPARLLEDTVAALDVGAKLEISRVDRSGIAATKVDVIIGGEKDMPREQYWRERENKKRHEHLTGHTHEHAHDHPHTHDSTQQGAVAITHEQPAHHTGTHVHGRGLKEIRGIIAAAPISDTAKQRAIAIFQALGEAEAKIHNADVETIHFHEVGSVDAIVDIVGAAVGSEALGVGEWVCSPLNVGGGTVRCAHGTFPVPAPATVEILKGAPIYSGELQFELVTPTGAAIARTLATRFAPMPAMRIDKIGYGAGTRNFDQHANVLRLSIGEAVSERDVASYAATEQHGAAATDVVRVIEANLDDATPQLLGYVQERLMAAGALDVYCTPIQMKKNRPGTLLSVLARPANEANLVDILFAESTTLGVRIREEQRRVLERRTVAVQTPWGEVRIKVAHVGGEVRNAAPEFEDCRRIAAEHRIPLKQVIQAALNAWNEAEGNR